MKRQYCFNGKMLKSIRTAKGIPVSRLSLLTGIKHVNLHHYECGHAEPPLQNLLKIQKALQLDIFEFMIMIGCSPFEPMLLKRFMALCKKEEVQPQDVVRSLIMAYCGLIKGDNE